MWFFLNKIKKIDFTHEINRITKFRSQKKMSKNLYIAAAEKEAGKSIIVLGIMDFLAKHITKIGFFRPLVRSSKEMDHHIRLISERFNLKFDYKSMYGLASDEMANLVQSGDTDIIQSTILSKHKERDPMCDFLLEECTDVQGIEFIQLN